MAARKRNSLAPTPSSESQLTYTRFMELFPSHDACLDYLKDRFHPNGSEDWEATLKRTEDDFRKIQRKRFQDD